MSLTLTSEYFESVGIHVNQPRDGHRYGAESIVLAEFCRAGRCDRVAELGSGCGVISLVIAARDRPVSVTAIEIQKELHDIARENVLKNGLDGIIRCELSDYRDYAEKNPASFEIVVSNPPFYSMFSGRLSSNQGRAMARHEINGTIAELVTAAKKMLVPHGRLMLVFPRSRQEELIRASELLGFKAAQLVQRQDLGPNFLIELKAGG